MNAQYEWLAALESVQQVVSNKSYVYTDDNVIMYSKRNTHMSNINNNSHANDLDNESADHKPSRSQFRRRLLVWLPLIVLLIAVAIITFAKWRNDAEAVGVWASACSVLIVGAAASMRFNQAGSSIAEKVQEATESHD